MAEYVVVHGSIRSGDGFIETKMVDGEFELGLIDLTPKEAKKMDPTGDCLQLRADYEAELKEKAAAAARKKKSKLPEPEVAGAEEVDADEPEKEPGDKPAKTSKRKKGGG